MNKSTKENDRLTLTIYVIIIFAAFCSEIVTYDKSKAHQPDYFSVLIGVVGFFGIFMHAQRILNNNSFSQYAFVGLGILVVSLIKQFFTEYSQLPFLAAGLPLLFVGYFRMLTYLFYKDYPALDKMPTVIFATKFGQTYHDDKENGYRPPMRERLFSFMLLMGFFLVAFGLFKFLQIILHQFKG